jgi:hypothetical protein
MTDNGLDATGQAALVLRRLPDGDDERNEPMNENKPRLTDTARDEFRAALMRSADQIFAAPDAAEALSAFLDGDALIVLTRDRLWVKPVPQDVEQTQPAVPPDDTRGTGMYL